MISTSELQFDAPVCPKCDVPMAFARVMPTALPKEAGAETQIFKCGRCGKMVTRTLRKR